MNTPLMQAAQNVIDNWQAGNLSQAVNELRIQLEYLQNNPEPSHLFVTVGDGCLQNISDIEGKDYPNYSIIDYDCVESGVCPVCLDDGFDGDSCPECGYSKAEDNGLQCAIKLHNKQGTPS